MGFFKEIRDLNKLENAAGKGDVTEVRKLLAEGRFPNFRAISNAIQGGHKTVLIVLIEALKKESLQDQLNALDGARPVQLFPGAHRLLKKFDTIPPQVAECNRIIYDAIWNVIQKFPSHQRAALERKFSADRNRFR